MVGRKNELQVGSPNRGTYVVPIAWILVLVGCYWLLADWHSVPGLITAALGAIR